MHYSKIFVIYNPNSTGSSESLARKFQKDLLKRLPDQNIELQATKYAGHAEKLAYEYAKSKNALIISSSGDGGYNEVVNGAMKAKNEGHDSTVGLLPAGNANDHFQNTHTTDILDVIEKGEEKAIDVLTLTSTTENKPIHRYGHSYIGFGLTPIVGNELNKKKLNPFNELFTVAKAIFTLHSIKLTINGKTRHYQSIICSNVDTMSKFMKISQPSQINDGKFEVTIFKRRNKLAFIRMLLKTSIVAAQENAKVTEYDVQTVQKTLVQIDGEIITIDAHSQVTIGIEKQALRCIV